MASFLLMHCLNWPVVVDSGLLWSFYPVVIRNTYNTPFQSHQMQNKTLARILDFGVDVNQGQPLIFYAWDDCKESTFHLL